MCGDNINGLGFVCIHGPPTRTTKVTILKRLI